MTGDDESEDQQVYVLEICRDLENPDESEDSDYRTYPKSR